MDNQELKDKFFYKIPTEIFTYGWSMYLNPQQLGLYISLISLEVLIHREFSINTEKEIEISIRATAESMGIGFNTYKKLLDSLEDTGLIKTYRDNVGKTKTKIKIIKPIPMPRKVDIIEDYLNKIAGQGYRESLNNQINKYRNGENESVEGESNMANKPSIEPIDGQIDLLGAMGLNEDKNASKPKRKPPVDKRNNKRYMIGELVEILHTLEPFQIASKTYLFTLVGKILKDDEYKNFEHVKECFKMLQVEGYNRPIYKAKLMPFLKELVRYPQGVCPNAYKISLEHKKTQKDSDRIKNIYEKAGEIKSDVEYKDNELSDLEDILKDAKKKKLKK